MRRRALAEPTAGTIPRHLIDHHGEDPAYAYGEAPGVLLELHDRIHAVHRGLDHIHTEVDPAREPIAAAVETYFLAELPHIVNRAGIARDIAALFEPHGVVVGDPPVPLYHLKEA